MANPRGVQVSDVPTSLRVVVPIDSAAIIAFGTAPVGSVALNPDGTPIVWTTPGSGASPYSQLVNKPILCEIPSDFTTQLGLTTSFGPGNAIDYSLAGVYDYAFVENSVSPLVCVNLFDPWAMSTSVSRTGLVIVNDEIQIVGEVILPSLKVVGQTGKTYASGVDYSYSYNDETLQTGTLTVMSTSTLATETTVNCFWYTPNLAAITPTMVEGGTDVNGNNFGCEVLEDVFTVTGIVPATVITPGWGHNSGVYAAFNSHVQNINNGRFRAIYIGDIDTSAVTQYSQINSWKNTNNFESAFTLAGWPHVGLAGKRYHASTVLAVTMANTDKTFGGIPYCSPSNKYVAMDSTILHNGTPVAVNTAQADYIENLGIFTFLNFQGWKSLGDYTNAWPTNTDPIEFWINERRMFNWLGNEMSLLLAQFIDLPGSLRTLTIIENSAQAFLNTIVQQGAAWTARISFNPNENLPEQILSGIYTYHILWSPPTPIRTLDLLLEFDVNGLSASIASINIVSS